MSYKKQGGFPRQAGRRREAVAVSPSMTSSVCREEFKRDGVAEVFALGLDCAACVAPRFLSDGDGKGGRLGPCRGRRRQRVSRESGPFALGGVRWAMGAGMVLSGA